MSELIGKWNYYFLRYGAGTIVGAVIVALFTGHLALECPFFKILSPDKLNGPVVMMYVVLGFAYCYIASAPGTVFHAARGLFWNQNERKKCQPPKPCFWLLVSLTLIFALVLVLVAGCCCRYHHCLQSFCVAIPLVFSVAILAFQWLLIGFTFTRFERVKVFYEMLTEKRAKGLITRNTEQKTESKIEKTTENGNKVGEYVESFRDLREHGNAFEIIFLEIVLAITLFALNYRSALLFIVLWIFPAALCWTVGTLLEFRFLEPPSTPPNSTNNQNPSPEC
ncbi:MAG: hypothetical protein ABSB84_03735 [Verrucomicrobiota bacterium]|jgi:hypothetical protein